MIRFIRWLFRCRHWGLWNASFDVETDDSGRDHVTRIWAKCGHCGETVININISDA